MVSGRRRVDHAVSRCSDDTRSAADGPSYRSRAARCRASLLDDTEAKMGYPRRLDHPRAFQFNWFSAEMLEQSDTLSKQDGHQIDGYFVKKPGCEALLHDLRGGYGDILISCCIFCLPNGAFNAIGDEGEWRSFRDPFLWDAMGNNKTRCKGVIAAPGAGDIEH